MFVIEEQEYMYKQEHSSFVAGASHLMLNTKALVVVLVMVICTGAVGQVRLPRLISDGMVLQREANDTVWGWTKAGELVSVQFLGTTHSTTADEQGKWSVVLSPMAAGGPFEMTIRSGDSVTKLSDILVGDVWVCSGQSNMELTMERVSPIYKSEIANCENSSIRQFEVPDRYDFTGPEDDIPSGSWEKTNPATILHFSAAAYFFGKELNDTYHVPIGLINTALGGSPAESWMSEKALREFPGIHDEAMRFKDSTLIMKIQRDDRARIQEWYARSWQTDEGSRNPADTWSSPAHDASDWSTMNIPGSWAEGPLGPVNGVVWFRKDIDLPSAFAGKVARLLLGRIVDADSVFVNGVFVGTTSYQYPPRRYEVPAGILREGKNTLVVRVISNTGRGEFVEDKPYVLIADTDTVDLKGAWHYQLGDTMEPLRGETFIRWKPEGLFNAMLAPLLRTSVKGVIWYQGESNAGRPIEYRTLFPALINDWREQWHRPDLPFLFVQLPNFMEAKAEPSESNWALLREAQLKTLSLPNTAMAVTIDIGEWNDIHPLDKKDVGRRLALAAENKAYGNTTIVSSGPVYESMKVDHNKVILTFSHIGGGLEAKGGDELKSFAICGADKKFVWAHAEIRDDKVVVWSDDVTNPVAVRYAWADNPVGANLYNKEGLPASPFRTDEFSATRPPGGSY
jgi:sialate O-acetylesterase